MSRKDYVALAEALGQADTVADATDNVVRVLAADNPRFDKGRFLDFVAKVRGAR